MNSYNKDTVAFRRKGSTVIKFSWASISLLPASPTIRYQPSPFNHGPYNLLWLAFLSYEEMWRPNNNRTQMVAKRSSSICLSSILCRTGMDYFLNVIIRSNKIAFHKNGACVSNKTKSPKSCIQSAHLQGLDQWTKWTVAHHDQNMKEAQFNFCKSFRYIFEQGIIAQIFTKNIFYVRSPISPWLGPQQRLLFWNCFVFLIILYLFLTPPSIIFCLLLWKIRDISSQFFSLYFGVYNINFGLATSQFQLCQNINFFSTAGLHLVLLQLENRCIYFELKLSWPQLCVNLKVVTYQSPGNHV